MYRNFKLGRQFAKVVLRGQVAKVLRDQGYEVSENSFRLIKSGRDGMRELHKHSRAERIRANIRFIRSFQAIAEQRMLDSNEVTVDRIKPRLISVQSGTQDADFFRWWNLTWWSLPHEPAYGRQMRFIVWDDYHDAPIGLIGLQSPLLAWKVRDDHLGISAEKRDYWVNQSLSAQRIGALPPYNKFLGGKLVDLVMMSDGVRNAFKEKYAGKKTVMLKRELPARLLFITTTGAYGKSSVHNRLKFDGEKICQFIGYTGGNGAFHIPNSLYESFIRYLRDEGYKAPRSFGNGPSVKMKNIDQAMSLLGYKDGCVHGIKRAIYLFPFARNLKEVIRDNAKPVWYQREIGALTDYWKERWARDPEQHGEKTKFSKGEYLRDLEKDLRNCEKLVLRN